jgi:hypothetical protein
VLLDSERGTNQTEKSLNHLCRDRNLVEHPVNRHAQEEKRTKSLVA